MNETSTLVGHDWLEDEALARIVEADLKNHGELTTKEARIAFAELTRRSEHARANPPSGA